MPLVLAVPTRDWNRCGLLLLAFALACASKEHPPANSPTPAQLVVSAQSMTVEGERATLALVVENRSGVDASICLDPDQLLALALTDAAGAAVQIVGKTIGEGPAMCVSERRLRPSESWSGEVTFRGLSSKSAVGGELTFAVPVTIGSARSCRAEIAVHFFKGKIRSQQARWSCGG